MVLDIFLVDGGMLRIDPDEIEAAACESFGKKRAVKANVSQPEPFRQRFYR